MSMPWLHGTAGLARQSPALPLRDTSTLCLRRYRKASAITRMASWVRADVYCEKQTPVKYDFCCSRCFTRRAVLRVKKEEIRDCGAVIWKLLEYESCLYSRTSSGQVILTMSLRKDSDRHIFFGFARVSTLKLWEVRGGGSLKMLNKMNCGIVMICLTDLQWSVFGFWKFSFIQALPALEELLDDGAVWVDDLESCDVGSTRKHPVQADVGKTLSAMRKTGWWWSREPLAAKKRAFKNHLSLSVMSLFSQFRLITALHCCL